LFFKGIYFMVHRDHLLQILDKAGTWMIAPVAIAHYVVPVHLVGGVLLAVGLLTRVAALAQIPILIGAVFYIHLPELTQVEPRQNFELSALVLFLTCLVCLHGSGRFSVDHLISKGQHHDTRPLPRPA
jgi:uncharacterized membrane protein YphA (DoxX/SURF4 family)